MQRLIQSPLSTTEFHPPQISGQDRLNVCTAQKSAKLKKTISETGLPPLPHSPLPPTESKHFNCFFFSPRIRTIHPPTTQSLLSNCSSHLFLKKFHPDSSWQEYFIRINRTFRITDNSQPTLSYIELISLTASVTCSNLYIEYV